MTTTERTAMNDKTPPCVIDASEARVGDVLELSDYGDDPNQRIIGTLSKFDAVGGWLIHEAPKITLLERPEPPKPALPTEPGTVIRCTLDAERTGRSTATMIRDGFGGWRGPDLSGDSRDVTESESDRITDWVVVYDPSAPKADDGLRERMVELADEFARVGAEDRLINEWHKGYTKACDAVAHRIRRELAESLAKIVPADGPSASADGLRERVETMLAHIQWQAGIDSSAGGDFNRGAAFASRGTAAHLTRILNKTSADE